MLEHVSVGGLLAYPTETVYGFGGVLTRSVIEGLVALKRRDRAKPMLLLVPDREAESDLTWTPEAIELAEVFWPGSVTLVLSDPGARYPDGVRRQDQVILVTCVAKVGPVSPTKIKGTIPATQGTSTHAVHTILID